MKNEDWWTGMMVGVVLGVGFFGFVCVCLGFANELVAWLK